MGASAAIIRDAVPAEAAHLSALALRSKGYWGYDDAFLEACRDELTYSAEDVSVGWYRVAEVGGHLVGFAALNGRGSHEVELDALFVDPPWIGRGIGRSLMVDAMQMARMAGSAAMIIQGDPHADAFYRAAGARRIGTRESGSIRGRLLPLYRIELA